MQSDLSTLSAVRLVEGYRKRAFSPVEVLSQTLDTIAALNPALNAFALLDPDSAMETARASEARWMRGEPAGLIDGVPTTVKDLAVAKGWPRYGGSNTLPAEPAPDTFDGPQVARLREEGAVLLGKTTQPEFAWKGLTDSPRFGITRNPWNLERTPGGSSGGAAAGVAAYMGPLALGTDGSGSVRLPAAFTGLAGLKPTYGLIPQHPRATHMGDIVHTGPLARGVADVALMTQVMSGPDRRDWTSPPHSIRCFDTLTPRMKGLRIAFSPTLGFAAVEPGVAAIVRRAVDKLAGLGAEIDEVDPGFEDTRDMIDMIYKAGAACTAYAMPEEARARMDPKYLAFATSGLGFSATEYVAIAKMKRDALCARMVAFHETYDLLITPQMGLTAVPADESLHPPSYSHWFDFAPFCYPFNLTQQPAATVPCGVAADGLPVAIQIVGPKFADALVLDASLAAEQAFGFEPLSRERAFENCNEFQREKKGHAHA
ncbi:MAG: amidase [Aquamicrobium sp.]|uniref:amidase n=1 Tax=Aquamicrobium sp. TaxID=1872579 RepID=UPI00349EBA33|nr:amidase [Aquamicrobium sp.]